MQILFDINNADDIARVQELLSQLAPGTASAAVVAPAQPAPCAPMPANVTPMQPAPATVTPAPTPLADDAKKQALLASIRDVCRTLGAQVQMVGQRLRSHYDVSNASELNEAQLSELHQWCVQLQGQA